MRVQNRDTLNSHESVSSRLFSVDFALATELSQHQKDLKLQKFKIAVKYYLH
jgi:hypothetical protein